MLALGMLSVNLSEFKQCVRNHRNRLQTLQKSFLLRKQQQQQKVMTAHNLLYNAHLQCMNATKSPRCYFENF